MKVFMTGGTGFVGTTLTRNLVEQDHQVTVLTRKIPVNDTLPHGVSLLEGDPTRRGEWQRRVPQHDIIVNLAGASIFMRWDKKGKAVIRESRVSTTTNLIEALSDGMKNETTFISTSAVGYYGFHGDETLEEDSPPGDDFLASVTREWEAAAIQAEAFGARVLVCRLGIVLGRNGGALGEMLPLFQKGLGSPLGSGNQWFSWIHEMDLVGIYLFLIAKKDLSGPINCTAPEPVRNNDLTQALGKALGKRTFMPSVPGFVIKLIKGEFGSVLLEGQRVLPKKLLDAGFHFRFSRIDEALNDLLG
ncbi:MAG: TIGR01777 family protein [Desulfobacteraceae bacterium]|nr:TIGR01777 family protein [Desulfobacteraceae bacterium]MBL7101542.1 TIGR01777 family protein [Desulfobacteraceae bacterium]MBL7172218.1 TIGR01777 family protein [Desulfobacteraceae bacterium]